MSGPSEVDVAALRTLATAATPGPWVTEERAVYWVIFPARFSASKGHIAGGLPADGADARFIAAVDPPTVTALCDELDGLRTIARILAAGTKIERAGTVLGYWASDGKLRHWVPFTPAEAALLDGLTGDTP